MTDLLPTTRPALRPDRGRYQRTEDGFILYDLARDAVFEGNRTALEILRQLDGASTCRQIGHRLARRYSMPAPAAMVDLRAFLGELDGLGLLEVR